MGICCRKVLNFLKNAFEVLKKIFPLCGEIILELSKMKHFNCHNEENTGWDFDLYEYNDEYESWMQS